MYLWRKRATAHWLTANEEALQAQASPNLAIIELSGRKQLCLEVACKSARDARVLRDRFGGHCEKLRRHWLERFASAAKTKPLRIGRRLLITRSGGFPAAELHPTAAGKPALLIIPAAAAFGTGEHATTAMSLRLLEEVIRGGRVRSPEVMVDLGTGSGVLALAARRLGIRQVIGIDVDPIAISTAKGNAKRNKIDRVTFKVADARRWNVPSNTEIVAANLFSELLSDILPKLRAVPWLILSGVMRGQEAELTRALKRANIKTLKIRRRGKWIAVLAKGHPVSEP